MTETLDRTLSTATTPDRFARSREVAARLRAVVPGGSHTYAKGEDQYPEGMAPVIARGCGSHVWDVDGNEYIEYGSGLRSVTLGHAHPRVTGAVRRALDLGSNFVRPAAAELDAAEALLSVVPRADMVKFTKNGSDATTAAIRLARAATGRDMVAVCRDHPFFSSDDWFIGTTAMSAGIPDAARQLTVGFGYNDLASLEAVLSAHPARIAAVVLEAAGAVEPEDGFLAGVRTLCDAHGALLVLDEMITGLRWAVGGAQEVYDVEPDLCTFGKALGNGFALSALAGRREYMRLGGFDHEHDRVFLLSSTHGAEMHALAAGMAVLDTYRTEPIIDLLYLRGAQLAEGVRRAAEEAGIADHLELRGRSCNLVYLTRDADGQPSQAFRTLFLQELLQRGILAPSFVVSAALSEADVAATVDAVAAACRVYRAALEDGVEHHLVGRPVRPPFRRRG